VNARRCTAMPSLVPLLGVIALALNTAAAAEDACPTFKPGSGGTEVSVAFSVDAERHAVIPPPQCAGGEELLWIHPLRLNPDEYLILQKCVSADCSKAEVVRAWNSYGTMGPYPVLTPKIPLVFMPFGSVLEYPWAREALAAAVARGPTKVERSEQKDSAYVATFEGGSSVWMRAMRKQDRSS
jgi:hypothetical protein